MFEFTFNISEREKMLDSLAEYLGVELKDDLLQLPVDLGNGYFRREKLPNKLDALIFHFTLHDDFWLNRKKSDQEYYVFVCEEIENTGELVFEDVKVPVENVLPNVRGMKGPLSCLNKARYGISWGAIGAAVDCYDTALRYSKERIQFGKPIAGFQLTQKKLAEMITEITKAQLLSWRLGTLANVGKASPAQISMAKRNNVAMACQIARDARQMLGGMGITGDFSIMRHMMNLESVITYEGTHDIHLLITGMDVTGISAFK